MSTDSWASAVSGDWNTAADWSSGASPTAATAAAITLPGSYVVTLFGTAAAASLLLGAAGAEFYDAGGLALGGLLTLQAGTLALAYGGITGGTLAMDGGTLLATGGTLNKVAVQGVLNLGIAESSLFVQNGLSLSGAGGSGAGSIALTGAYAALDFIGNQTLSNAVVSLGAAGSQPGQAGPATLAIVHAAGATAGATLTLGSSVWVRDSAGQGALTVGSAGQVQGAALPDQLVNQGTITASGAGVALSVSGSGTFANQGTLTVSGGATLTLATAGFSNSGRISVSDATLALGGNFTPGLLSSLGSVAVSSGQVAIAGTLALGGGTLAVGSGSSVTASLGALSLAGTLSGGSVLDAGGGLTFAAATGLLDDVAYVGTLNLSAGGAGVILTDGTQIDGAGGAAGSIVATGRGAALLLRGSETLDNATITLGGSGAGAMIGTSDAFLAGSATTATLGPDVLVRQTGTAAAIMVNGTSPIPGFGSPDALVNQGTITAAFAGGLLGIGGIGSFINQGFINVSSGDTLAVSVAQFGNSGTLTASAGGVVQLGQPASFFGTPPDWSNAGRIVLDGGTLTLAGSVTTAQLGTVTQTAGAGGSILLAGTLSNAAATLTLGAGAPPSFSLPVLSLSGTISGGRIVDPGGVLAAGAAGAAVLDGVSYAGTLALLQSNAFLTIRDGLGLAGAIDITGAGSVLDFDGTETLAQGQISLGSAAAAAASLDVSNDGSAPGGSTLTLGSGVTITQAGALGCIGQADGVAGDAIVNAGTITAAVAGGTLALGGPDFINQGRIAVSHGDTLSVTAAGFTNTGSLTVANGVLALTGSLTLAGLGQVVLTNSVMAVSGTLSLGTGTLSIGLGSAIGRLQLTGTLAGGTVADAGSGLAASGAAQLDDVTYAGLLDLSRPFAQLSIADGIDLTGKGGSGAGSILLTGAQASLVATTSETIDNAQITLGSPAQSYQGHVLPAPKLAAAAATQLTIGAHTTVTLAGTAGTLGDSGLGQWTDSIVNAGQILAASKGGTLSIGSSFFTNDGLMAATAGGILTIGDTGFTNTGTLEAGAGSAVQISLYDYYAAPNAGATVLTNAGTIALQGGIFHELTANGLFPNVPIVNLPGADIVGSGMVFAEIQNAGTIEAHGGALVLEESVMGTGSLLIDSGSRLALSTSLAASQTVNFASGGGTLIVDQPASFAGTLANFSTGDVLDLPGLALISVGISNGTLVASTATQNFRFAATPLLAGALSSGRDAYGGATITITPQKVGGGAPAILPVSQSGMLFWASPAGDVFQGISADLNTAHIGNWSAADSVDLLDLASSTATLSVTLTPGLTTLHLSDGHHAASIGLAGTFAAAGFHLASDGATGTMLTYGTHG